MADYSDDYQVGQPTLTQPTQPLTLGVPQTGVGKLQGPQNLDPVLNRAIDISRPFLGNLGATGAEALTAPTGPIGQTVAGTAAYAGIDTLLKSLKTQQNPDETFGSSIKDGLVNGVANRILGAIGVFRNAGIPDIYKFAPTTSQALESYGMHALGTSAKFAEDYFARGASSRALDRAGGAGFSQALGFSNLLNGKGQLNRAPDLLLPDIKSELEKGINTNAVKGQFQNPQHYASQDALATLKGAHEDPFGALNDVIYDNSKLNKVLAASMSTNTPGVRGDLAAYQFMKMINDATSTTAKGGIRIDPQALTKIWKEPTYQPALDTLYGSNKSAADQLINNIITTQQPQLPVPKKLSYVGGGVFALSAANMLQHMSFSGLGNEAATAAAVLIPSAGIGRILTNPKMARYLVAASGGEKVDMPAKWVARALVDGLQGSMIGIQNADGSRTWGNLNETKDGDVNFTRR